MYAGIHEIETQESFVRRPDASKLNFRTSLLSDTETILSDGSSHFATLVDTMLPLLPEGKAIFCTIRVTHRRVGCFLLVHIQFDVLSLVSRPMIGHPIFGHNRVFQPIEAAITMYSYNSTKID